MWNRAVRAQDGVLWERRFHHPHFQRFAGQNAGQGEGLVNARHRTADNFGTTSWSEVRAASLNDDRCSVVHQSIDHVDHTREADSDSAFTDEKLVVFCLGTFFGSSAGMTLRCSVRCRLSEY
jgi:hypothetical protein